MKMFHVKQWFCRKYKIFQYKDFVPRGTRNYFNYQLSPLAPHLPETVQQCFQRHIFSLVLLLFFLNVSVVLNC